MDASSDGGERFDDLLSGLAAELEARDAAEDDALAAELARAEVAEVTLLDRLRAAARVTIEVVDHGPVVGSVDDVGSDAVFLVADDGDWALPIWGISAVIGLTDASTPPGSALSRRGFAARMRGWQVDALPVRVLRVGAAPLTGTIARVGADHLDLAEHDPGEPARGGSRRAAIPFSAIGAVNRR